MAKKHLGQNFLFDASIIDRIIQAARLESRDLVVEIGPGPGKMTKMLAERAAKVLAIELDEYLYRKLAGETGEWANIELIHGDALEYPFEDLSEFKVVANIPYYITTPILFRLLESRKNMRSMTLTVQKEVAERIVAAPGGKDYGVLSIMVQYHAKPELKFIIPKEAFRPVPKVDSALVHIETLSRPSVEVSDQELFSRIVRTAFSQRRKMLSNSLRSLRQDVREWLAKAGIDPNRRPETLSLQEFADLTNIF